MQTTKTITKRIWGVLLALCMLLSLMPMAAFAAEDPGVVYDYQFVTEDTIEIMGYNGTETDLVIPSQINGYTVVGIGNLDLLGNGTNTVESVVVPGTVKYIKRFAYYPNTAYSVGNLEKVTLPEGLETIGDDAFASAPGLSEINLPSTLKSIGESAFKNCKVDNFTIPAGVEYIGANAFLGTEMVYNLMERVWDGGDPFIVIGGELVCYFGDDPVVTVPDGVRGIATDAFSLARTENSKVTSVTLPDSVEYIAESAFGAQSELTTVNFGSGLKEIGFGAFGGCASLNNVVLPEGLKKIGDNAFAGCSSLDSISFPSTLEVLYPGSLERTPYWENLPGGENYLGRVFCFKETELDPWTPLHVDVRPGTLGIMEWQSSHYDTTMSLPDGLRYIGPDAFPSRMYELDDFTLPESVTYIDDVPNGHRGVPKSALRDLPDALTYIGMNAFESDYQIDIGYLEIPNGVKYIGQKAFAHINTGSSQKMDVRLPDSLEYMDWAAFTNNNIGQITNWSAAITTWEDFLYDCQMDALTLPDTILNVHRLTSSAIPIINLNRVKVVEGFYGYGGVDILSYGAIQPGSGTILMPNVERVFPNTHIGGAGAGVVAIPNMDVYVPFNGVDEGFDEHLKVVIFDESMLEGLPSAPSSVAPMVGSFTDVRTNDWFAGAVEYVVNNGLFSGVSDTSFAPNEPVTRGMLVTVLWRAAGEPSSSASAFADVPSDAWYAKAVAWANANGIVQGYDASTFAPDDRITREQLAAIFQRYAGFKGMETSGRGDLSQFGDTGALSNWAQEGVSWAVGAGLISGKGDGVLDPQGATTRAEAAVILQRFLEK